MRCTVPKCNSQINGMTGLQELEKIMKHFASKHKIRLSLPEAMEVRINLEDGKEPNLLRAMLGTEQLTRKSSS